MLFDSTNRAYFISCFFPINSIKEKFKFWGLLSEQLQRSYPDPAFAASSGGTGKQA